MEIDHDLENVLCEVRKAYRLIAAYQRRILDMAKKIQNSLGYKPYQHDHPNIGLRPRGDNLPTVRRSIDMLPLYNDLYMLYLPPKAEVFSPKRDEWMLEVTFNNDTGFKIINNNEEPDPLNFDDVESCTSRLWLCAFGVKKNMENTQWWSSVYCQIKKPTDNSHVDTEKLWAAGKSYNLAKIPDEKALNQVVDDFRGFVEGKRKEIGVL